MIDRIKKLLAPPVFQGDEEKTRLARLLNVILIIVMLLVMLFSVPALVITPQIGRVAIEFLLAALAVGMLFLLRRGYVRPAGFLLSLTIWGMVTYGTYEAGGFRGSIMSAYFGIILIAELMLGAWAGIVFGVLSIVATGWMLLADQANLLPPVPEYATLTTFWVEFSVVVIGVVGLLTLVMNSLHEALHRARRNERELAQKVIEVQEFAQRAVEASDFKSRLIARVSHELRTPLGAMLGIAEMLQLAAHGSLPPEQKDLMLRIIENSRHLDRVFSGLVVQSELEAGQLSIREIPTSPAHLLRQVETIHRPDAERKGLSLHTHLDPTLPPILVSDPMRLETVLANLLRNAIKFTESGSIAVEVLSADADRWVLKVSDTGIGIPADAHGYIFEPFRQVDESISRRYGGVGLGLSISNQLVQAMKGSITVESELGKGSTFTVSLPLRLVSDASHGMVRQRSPL
ncbi:MAG: sensor histidine kinase [Chloroflexota bacterium]